jgi:hypothetical protein
MWFKLPLVAALPHVTTSEFPETIDASKLAEHLTAADGSMRRK